MSQIYKYITFYPENCVITPETVISPAGYSYVTQDTVTSPSRVFGLNTNQIGFDIQVAVAKQSKRGADL